MLKGLRYMLGIAVFGLIVCTPWVYWESAREISNSGSFPGATMSHSEAQSAYYFMGMTMLLWLPASIALGAWLGWKIGGFGKRSDE